MAIYQYGIGNSTPELDSTDTANRSSTELDRHEVPQALTQHPGVHELPGSEVGAGMHRVKSTVVVLPLCSTGREKSLAGTHNVRSLFLHWVVFIEGKDRRPISDIVSPSSTSRSVGHL